ncbi:MAG: antibiotic biosynthesis monooxygenase [Ignavibacterium sp.]|jgi:heme-degrading monooxygenase HmoA
MIARLWHGRTKAEDVDEYLEYLNRTGIPDYRRTPGNRGVQVLVRKQDDEAHFLLVTLWDSYEAIRRFAGDEYEQARYYPDDARWLLEFEPGVVHYEVAVHLPSESPSSA